MPDMAVVVGAGKSSTTLPSTGAESTIDKTKPARTRKKGEITPEKKKNKTNTAANTPAKGVISAVQQRRKNKAKESQLKKQRFMHGVVSLKTAQCTRKGVEACSPESMEDD